MSASQDAMTVAHNAGFQDRIRYHLTKAAIDVMAETGDTADHEARAAYARKVLDGSANYYSAVVAVLTNATIAASINLEAADLGIADDPLPFTVNSLFGALAGVSS